MMLSDFSIKRPVITLVLTLAMMALGALALSKLRVNERPDIAPPVIQVSVPYPGASPETVEREIVARLEKAMRGIAGVHDMRAWANEGNAWFRVEFEFGADLIEASDNLRNAIASVRYKLPVEMREPVIRRVDPDAWPIMSLSLSSSSQSALELSVMADKTIGDRLRALPGVAVVEVSGDSKRELSVLLRSEKMRMHGISVVEIQNSLQRQNISAPSGKVSGSLEDVSIRLEGRLPSPESFAQMVVRRQGEQILRLGDVAEVVDGTAEPDNLNFYNGKPSIGINVIRTREASTVAVSAAVRQALDELRPELKPGTQLEIANDGGDWAKESLYNVIEALILGAGLTIFVVYAFLNSWRSTLITALSLPTSVLAAFIAVWLLGFSLNFMTLLGLSLAIGVLIDDAIVVRENIVQHMERGSDRMTASREGTREIGLAVMATTFSIVAVFVPVAFMSGGPGQWFKPFALTVVASVLVSLLVSFSLDPLLSSRWGDPVGYAHQNKRGISKLLARFNTWFDHQADRYTAVIRWALRHRTAMALIALASLVAALSLQKNFGGTSFLPASDNGQLVVRINLPSGASLEYARIKTAQAVEQAQKIPEVKSLFSSVNRDESRLDIDIGKPSTRERDAATIARELRGHIQQLVGAEYSVMDDTNNGGDKPVRINFYGQDSRKLMEITENYMLQLRQVKGAVDVGLSEKDPMPELRVELHRGLASSIGVMAADAAQALRLAFAGTEVGDWIDPNGETRDVALRLHPDDRSDVQSLASLPLVVSGAGELVPLEHLASIRMDQAPTRIVHTDGKRTLTVMANVEGANQGEVIGKAMALAKAIDFPPGYGIELRGAGREQQVLFTSMTIALVSGIALMYFILVMQFNSFMAPVAVMLSLPLSLIGVVVALVSTGHTLNLMSFIGIIMLMGLVAKNAILLLDSARAKELAGMPRDQALMQAGRTRLRPIIMTTFALIAGMLPVAIGMGEGGEFYQPLAVAIIGGTLTSTLLTLLMIPTFYDGISSAQTRWIAKAQRLTQEYGGFRAGLWMLVETLLTLVLLRWAWRTLGYLRRRWWVKAQA
jgi:hydrophobic/amphiphilic exporter-1 (mainly G- bacteria), HAE1 family